MQNIFKFNKGNLLKIFVYLIFYSLRTFFLVLLLSIFGISRVSIPVGTSLSLLFGFVVLLILFSFLNQRTIANLNLRSVSINKILLLIPLALIIKLPFFLIVFLPFIPKDPEAVSQSLNQFSLGSNTVYLFGDILTIINVALLAPILEELFFRGVVFNTLKSKYSVLISIVVSSFLFSLVHGNILLITTSFIHGLIFAFIYHKYKNIIYPVALHSFNNIIPLIFALT